MIMKRTLIAILGGLALGAAGTWSFMSRHAAADMHHEDHKDGEKEHGEAHSPTEVKLNREMQTSAGVRTATPQAAEWKPEIKGYGRALDPTSLVNGLFDIDTALAALAASSKEHARLAVLFGQNQNASLQALEAAEAAMKRDQLLLASARTRLMTTWGRNLAGRTDLPALAESLASMQAVLVRIDLMPGQSWEPTPAARIASLASADKLSEAEFVGAAPSADPQTQGLAFLFLLRTNAPAPGTAIVGFLPSSGAAESGWRLPQSALVRHEGSVWFYTQTGDETFERQPAKLERRLTDGWFVSEGVEATNKLVITGAQMLLSEQLKGAGGEE